MVLRFFSYFYSYFALPLAGRRRVPFFLLAQKERDERKRAHRNRKPIHAFMNVLGRSIEGTSCPCN